MLRNGVEKKSFNGFQRQVTVLRQDPTLFFFGYQLKEKGTIPSLFFAYHKKGAFFWNCEKETRAKPGFRATLTNGHIVTLSNAYLSFEIDATWMKLPY